VVYTETVQRLYETGDVERLNRVTGGADPQEICESPLLTGRVAARLAAEPGKRQPPYLCAAAGLGGGRVCVAAEGAEAFGIRDGGPPGTVAAELFGPDRPAAPSLRSLGYLGPAMLRDKLSPELRWLASPGGPLANRGLKVPMEWMAQDPRTEDPRKQDLKELAAQFQQGSSPAL